MQVLDIIHDLLKSRRDGKAAPVRDVAEEDVEAADLLAEPGVEIAVPHRQLIEIAEHGQIDAVCTFHSKRTSFPALYTDIIVFPARKNNDRQTFVKKRPGAVDFTLFLVYSDSW